MRLSHIFIAFFIMTLLSCGGTENMSSNREVPSWVQSKPQDPFAYIGIGVARVQQDGSHLQTAKTAALSDLSSEISVEISSMSLLHQMEFNRRFREEFRAQTEITSSENVEGFEQVDSYEKDGYYWVQYRLDRGIYAQIRADRKQAAISRALNYYNLAKAAASEHQIQGALTHAFTALGEIKAYLNESVPVGGMDEDLAISLYSFIDSVLSSIEVVAVERELELTRYSQNRNQVFFRTRTVDGYTLNNIPVYVYYTGGFLRDAQLLSNNRGEVVLTIPAAGSENQYEQLEADINYVALASSATNDPLLRLMVTRHPSTKASVSLNVVAPKVFLQSGEYNGEVELLNQPIAAALRKFLLDNRFSIVSVKEEADLIISIDATSQNMGIQNQMHQARLTGEIVVTDETGNMLSSFPLDGFRGVQLSKEGASQDAFRRAIQELEDHEFRKLLLN